jgi:hypothetical protein
MMITNKRRLKFQWLPLYRSSYEPDVLTRHLIYKINQVERYNR